MPYTREKVSSLILELRKLQHEVPWVEFKSNNFTPDLIGENISLYQMLLPCMIDLMLIWFGVLMMKPMIL